ncbi:MAG: nicotinate-nicotinamide nucleotide adenylyltransferase [Clostridia bacterium]|nr:nicotinate-nicotinamide nucleotide adenylyltransferase [Clostridia bacterium]
MKKLGFFGGCFNPPTVAHIELIEKAIKENNLDMVYFVPMGDLYKKENLILANHRVNMLKLAIKEKMDILTISVDSKKELQAIDTFRIIQEKFNQSDNYFIMGSDNFEKIKFWKNSDELLNNYKYIILKRDNNISSSKVRDKVKNIEDVSQFICKDVEHYILENKLYK